MYLPIHSFTASKFTQSWHPSASPNSLDHGIQMHLQTPSITASKYYVKERWRVYGGPGVKEVGRVMGSIFGRPRSRLTSSHFHLILSYNENTHSFFPNFWSHSVCPRCRGSSTPGSTISSHPFPTLLEPEMPFLMNYVWMLREVRRSVDGVLPAF